MTELVTTEIPKTTQFTNAYAKIEGYPPIYGGKITFTAETKSDIEKIAGTNEPLQETIKETEYKWEIADARDHGFFNEIYGKCKTEGYRFPIVVVAKDGSGNWKVMARMNSCSYLGGKRTFGDGPITRAVSGNALGPYEEPNSEF